MLTNTFSKKPVKVALVNSENIITNKYFFVGNITNKLERAINSKDDKVLKEFYGSNYQKKLYSFTPIEKHLELITGGDEIDELMREIEESINEENQVKKKIQPKLETNYSNIVFYDYDNIGDLMNKIYVETGIAPYKQHLIWFYNGLSYNNYLIMTRSGVFTKPNIVNINKVTGTVMKQDLKLQYLETQRGIELKYVPNHFAKLCNYVTSSGIEIYLFNIDEYIDIFPYKNNEQMIEEYYNTFIKYYWPMFTKDIFVKYVNGRMNDLTIEYPIIFADTQRKLTKIYERESELLAKLYDPKLEIVQTQTSSVNFAFRNVVKVKLRTIFDQLATSTKFPKIIFHTTPEGIKVHDKKSSINIVKINNLSNVSQFIPKSFKEETILITANFNDNISGEIRITEQDILLRLYWNEQVAIKTSQLYKQISTLLSQFSQKINDIMKDRFDLLKHIEVILASNNLSTHKYLITGMITIDKFMSAPNFKKTRDVLSIFEKANILSVINVSNDKITLKFHKGMYSYVNEDIEAAIAASTTIKLDNYFMYLLDQTVKQKWDKMYDGKIVNIYRRPTSVKIEMIDCQLFELKIISHFMTVFLKLVESSGLFRHTEKLTINEEGKALSKLVEVDPVLYSFKSSMQKAYSRICQQKKQPRVFTENEVKNMSKSEKDKLVEYWNFTLDKPAYYSCPNPKYPHLSFTKNYHPNNYCLPCCAAKPISALNPKRQSIIKACLSTHRYIENLKNGDTNYVLNYSKTPLINRFTKIPKSSLSELFHLENPQEQFVIYGVEQTISLLSTFAFINDISTKDALTKILAMIDDSNFYSLLNGILPTYFSDVADLRVAMTRLISHDISFYTDFTSWNLLIMELLHYLNYNVIIFEELEDDFNLLIDPLIYITKPDNSVKFILMIKSELSTNPIVRIANNEIEQMIFSKDDEIIETLSIIIDDKMSNIIRTKNITLTDLLDNNFTIDKYYINKTNKCYAVDIHATYFPVEYSNYSAKNIKLKTVVDNSYHQTLQLIEKINKKIVHKKIEFEYLIKSKSNNKFYAFQDKSGLLYYFKYEDKVDIDLPVIETNYSMIDINNLIIKDETPTEDNRTKLFDISMYKNNVFQIFKDTIRATLKLYRQNVSFNKYIAELVKQKSKIITDEYRDFLATLVNDNQIDELVNHTERILDVFIDNRKTILSDKKIIQTLDSEGYFEIIKNLLKFDQASLIEIIKNIANEIAVEGKLPNNFKFPNYYTTCLEDKHQYCDGKKLILDGFSIDDFAKLYYDIYSNLFTKKLVVDTYEERIVDQYKFITNPNETLKIYY